jgi:hypothetical protein
MNARESITEARGSAPGFVMLIALLAGCANPSRNWGRASLASIEQNFALHAANEGLYRERLNSDQIAFAWPVGVQLTALTGAASIDRSYIPRLRQVIDATDQYWRTDSNGLGGYDASCRNTGLLDRYYDDNAWLVLALVEANDLPRARRTLSFVLSGEDDTLDGGIWWHETKRESKNTCSNAPAIVACLAVDALAGNHDHLPTAMRLHDWTDAHLRDQTGDGLYFDNINLNGKVDRTTWTYNTALMIRAKCMLFDATRDRRYLEDAQQLAQSAERRWVKPETGAFADDSQFAHLLAEAFLELADRGNDARHWRAVVRRAIEFVHARNVDSIGFHPKKWHETPIEPIKNPELIWQASAARAYWRAARH